MTTKLATKTHASKAEALTITDAKSMEEASAMRVALKSEDKKLKALKEKKMRPLLTAVAERRAEFKPFETILNSAITLVDKKMGTYQTQIRQEEEAKRDKIASRVKEGRGNLSMGAAAKQMSEIEAVETTIVSDQGATGFVTDYEIEISDITQVPFEYLKVELKKSIIKAAAKDGVAIPGLVIKEVQKPRNS